MLINQERGHPVLGENKFKFYTYCSVARKIIYTKQQQQQQ